MKNRILCRLMSLGTAVLLAAGMSAGSAAGTLGGPVYGAEQEISPVTMTQRASWTEEEFCGELTVEISGLSRWIEEYHRKQEQGNEEGENSALTPVLPEDPSEENGGDSGENDGEEASGGTTVPGAEETEGSGQETKVPGEASPEGNHPVEMIPEEEKNGGDTSGIEAAGEQGAPGGSISGGGTSGDSTSGDSTSGDGVSGNSTSGENTSETEIRESEPKGNTPAPMQPTDPAGTEGREAEVCGSEKTGNLLAGSAFWKSREAANTKPKAAHAFTQEGETYGISSCLLEDNAVEIPELKLLTRLSTYFRTEEENLPQGSTVQELMLPGNNGELEKGTEIICPLPAEAPAEEPVTIKIPLILREEYCYSEAACILPVLYRAKQEELPDTEENGGIVYKGTCLAAFGNREPQILALAQEEATLEKPAALADYTLSVETNTDAPKAGEQLRYQVTITNTGGQPLPLVAVQSSLNPPGISGYWSTEENQETDVSGQKAILTNLKEGESRHLCYLVNLPESLAEPVVNTITAQAQKTTDQKNTVVRGTSLKTTVTPLQASFAVNKSADRTTAAPGDTITYQICIRNTGERTLHSVLSTERFRAEHIQAQFTEKEGVRLNSNRTQALISQIPPGEVFSLEAVVTVPENLTAKELINEVLVRTKETGEKTVQSAAGVKILELSPTPQPTVIAASLYGGNDAALGSASPVSDSPKTSDDTPLELWAGILGLAAVAGIVFGCVKVKKQTLK